MIILAERDEPIYIHEARGELYVRIGKADKDSICAAVALARRREKDMNLRHSLSARSLLRKRAIFLFATWSYTYITFDPHAYVQAWKRTISVGVYVYGWGVKVGRKVKVKSEILFPIAYADSISAICQRVSIGLSIQLLSVWIFRQFQQYINVVYVFTMK